jgi:hypothetical protein
MFISYLTGHDFLFLSLSFLLEREKEKVQKGEKRKKFALLYSFRAIEYFTVT